MTLSAGDSSSHSLLTMKIISIVVLAVVSVAGFAAAKKIKGSRKAFACSCSFAAGVMLAVALVHLLPDAAESLRDWSEDSNNGYPLAHLFAGISFLILIGMDGLIQKYRRRIAAQRSCDSQVPTDVDQGHTEVKIPSDGKHKAIAFLCAIDFHSVLEGLGIGAAANSGQLWGTFFAVVSHKGLVALAVANELVLVESSKLFWIYCAIFSVASPVGIAIGCIVNAASPEKNISVGICLSMAAGTFLWGTTMECFPKALEGGSFLLMIFGFGAMALLAVWV